MTVSGGVFQGVRGGWFRLCRAFTSLLLPWECPICGAGDDGRRAGPFCERCRQELLARVGPACERCAMPVGPGVGRTDRCPECQRHRFGFDAAVALAAYDGPLRDLCIRLKHERDAWLADWLAGLVVEGRPELWGLLTEPGSLVVPVPLHWRRRLERGYNQSEELARGLARRLGLKFTRPLRRVRHTEILAGLSRAERRLRLRDAFRVWPWAGRRLRGRTVFLIDDILTTGATCGAAARALKRAGARRVIAVVVARAGDRVSTASPVPEASKQRGIAVTTETSTPTTKPTQPSGDLRIGTRGSPLARWQAEWVAARLREAHPGLGVTLIEIKTHGDRDRNTPLAQLGGLGLFTKEIQRALLEGSVDLAVHSLKDLPTRGPAGLILGAVPVREGLADALIAPQHKTLDALPDGATVGTGSLRRRAQLLYLRPGLNVVGLRGNVETRLNQALEGKLDAVVLAEAGLRRLGLDKHITEFLGPPRFLPAVGQGALGIECRDEDSVTRALLAALDHAPTRRAVLAERRALAELEGGCMIPLGAWGRDVDDSGVELALDVAVFDVDGRERVLASETGPAGDPEALGLRVAQLLRDQGAERLLARPSEGSH